ncbi:MULTISPECIES: hypothetical protein [Sinorhizobium]|uniref:hypothetical protein n=1 Tax=Sinorhizobium TaxID=28105 RepID=UPI000CD40996|nr:MULTISPECIES: hypothetical protein [Sinorhizobium]POH32058.1 hypothetical protein ATY30_11700 [Sinorhizobium americanum]
MSDEQGAAKHDTTLYVHYCEHPGCTKWGGFGFAAGKGEPRWFCFEHRPGRVDVGVVADDTSARGMKGLIR